MRERVGSPVSEPLIFSFFFFQNPNYSLLWIVDGCVEETVY